MKRRTVRAEQRAIKRMRWGWTSSPIVLACNAMQQGDEFVCRCGLRWDTHDARPACPKGR